MSRILQTPILSTNLVGLFWKNIIQSKTCRDEGRASANGAAAGSGFDLNRGHALCRQSHIEAAPVQHEFLGRLSRPVQELVLEVQRRTQIDIQVVVDDRLNRMGPFGWGNLEVEIEATRIQIHAPSNGYFPDGAVRHEVLHAARFHLEGVPKIALAHNVPWSQVLADALTHLDNAIEHLIIVPVELHHHPERRPHWEAMLREVCSVLPDVPPEHRRLAVFMHWTFLRHVLPGSPQIEVIRAFAMAHDLFEAAERFADQLIAAAHCKEEMASLIFLTAPELPKQHAAFEYIRSGASTSQAPIR